MKPLVSGLISKSVFHTGSILGPLLFNIDIKEIFYFTDATTITNYADDNTPDACDTPVDLVISRLENDSSNLGYWFKFNYLKYNEDKCQLLMNIDSPDLFINIGNENVHNSAQVKLLGIVFDTALNFGVFDAHVSKLCKKANQKLHALHKVSKYTNKDKLRSVKKSFVTSQFGYCPLVWMFHSRGLNNRINKIYERALSLVYKDHNQGSQDSGKPGKPGKVRDFFWSGKPGKPGKVREFF